METPRVSVVVYAREAVATIERALRSLESQDGIDEAEVIVADGSTDGTTDLVKSRFPWVRHLPLGPATMPALKAAAIRAAKAPIVAILDCADAAEPDWLREILEGLADENVAAVGGTVVLDGPPTAANRAAYLFEYGAFEPPIEAGPTEGDLPGNNVAYRRTHLVDDCVELLEREGFYKPLFHEAIRAAGGVLHLRPAMCVRHGTRHRFLPFARRRYHYGRCFGARRLRTLPAGRRLALRLLAPGIPVLLMARHVGRAWRRPSQRRILAHASWALLGVCLFWGVGEALGTWFGAGRSCDEFY